MIRPSDGNETNGTYQVAVSNRNRPSVLDVSRQVSIESFSA